MVKFKTRFLLISGNVIYTNEADFRHSRVIRTESVTRSGDHDDVIKWKHFPYYWPFVRGIHRSPVNSPHKSQGRGAFDFFL